MSLTSKLVAAGLLLLALIAAGWRIHYKVDKGGYDRAMAEVATKAEADRVMKQEGIDNISSTFTATSAKKTSINQTNSERLVNYVPSTDPMLSGCFRLYHDAVAAGQEVEYSCRGNAAPVPAATVAATVKSNYDGCNRNADQVELLQGIVNTMNGS